MEENNQKQEALLKSFLKFTSIWFATVYLVILALCKIFNVSIWSDQFVLSMIIGFVLYYCIALSFLDFYIHNKKNNMDTFTIALVAFICMMIGVGLTFRD